jgi:hypothetical protein
LSIYTSLQYIYILDAVSVRRLPLISLTRPLRLPPLPPASPLAHPMLRLLSLLALPLLAAVNASPSNASTFIVSTTARTGSTWGGVQLMVEDPSGQFIFSGAPSGSASGSTQHELQAEGDGLYVMSALFPSTPPAAVDERSLHCNVYWEVLLVNPLGIYQGTYNSTFVFSYSHSLNTMELVYEQNALRSAPKCKELTIEASAVLAGATCNDVEHGTDLKTAFAAGLATTLGISADSVSAWTQCSDTSTTTSSSRRLAQLSRLLEDGSLSFHFQISTHMPDLEDAETVYTLLQQTLASALEDDSLQANMLAAGLDSGVTVSDVELLEYSIEEDDVRDGGISTDELIDYMLIAVAGFFLCVIVLLTIMSTFCKRDEKDEPIQLIKKAGSDDFYTVDFYDAAGSSAMSVTPGANPKQASKKPDSYLRIGSGLDDTDDTY